MLWLNKLWSNGGKAVWRVSNVAFKDFLDLGLINVINANKSSDYTTNYGTVSVRVSRQLRCLIHCPVEDLLVGLFLSSYECVDRQNECMLDMAHQLLRVVHCKFKVVSFWTLLSVF